jgi:hypothetical protein
LRSVKKAKLIDFYAIPLVAHASFACVADTVKPNGFYEGNANNLIAHGEKISSPGI